MCVPVRSTCGIPAGIVRRTTYNISEDIDIIRYLSRNVPGVYYELAPDAGRLTQVEAGFLAEMLIEAALDKSMNVIVDGTMRDSDYYSGYIGRLRKGLFAEYKVGIIYVHVSDLTIAKQRSRQREGQILRRVPQQLIEETYIQVCKAMEVLSHLVNISLTVQNDGDTPRILNISLSNEGGTVTVYDNSANSFGGKDQEFLYSVIKDTFS